MLFLDTKRRDKTAAESTQINHARRIQHSNIAAKVGSVRKR